jgi:hypothetical protein
MEKYKADENASVKLNIFRENLGSAIGVAP